LKEEIDRLKIINNQFCKCKVKFRWYKQLNEKANKIFKEEFGEKLIKNE